MSDCDICVFVCTGLSIYLHNFICWFVRFLSSLSLFPVAEVSIGLSSRCFFLCLSELVWLFLCCLTSNWSLHCAVGPDWLHSRRTLHSQGARWGGWWLLVLSRSPSISAEICFLQVGFSRFTFLLFDHLLFDFFFFFLFLTFLSISSAYCVWLLDVLSLFSFSVKLSDYWHRCSPFPFISCMHCLIVCRPLSFCFCWWMPFFLDAWLHFTSICSHNQVISLCFSACCVFVCGSLPGFSLLWVVALESVSQTHLGIQTNPLCTSTITIGAIWPSPPAMPIKPPWNILESSQVR